MPQILNSTKSLKVERSIFVSAHLHHSKTPNAPDGHHQREAPSTWLLGHRPLGLQAAGHPGPKPLPATPAAGCSASCSSPPGTGGWKAQRLKRWKNDEFDWWKWKVFSDCWTTCSTLYSNWPVWMLIENSQPRFDVVQPPSCGSWPNFGWCLAVVPVWIWTVAP